MERKFRSRISIIWLVFIGVAMEYAAYGISIIEGSFFNPVSCIFTGIFVFIILSYNSCYYVLTDREILVYYMWGILGKPFGRFYISAITSVERSHNPINAPAASLKRLRIHFKKGYKWQRFFSSWAGIPLISPVREQEFLETLKTINPDIQSD